MRTFALLALLAGLSSAYLTYDCNYYFPASKSFYDLRPLKAQRETTLQTAEGKIVFNLCKKIPVPAQCTNKVPRSFGYHVYNESTCAPILTDEVEMDDVLLRDKSAMSGFFRHSFGSDITFEIVCNADLSAPNFTLKDSTVVVQAREGCGQPIHSTRIYKTVYRAILVLVMFWGLFLAFFGGLWWNKIIGVFGFVLGACSVAVVLGISVMAEEGVVPWYAYFIFLALSVLTGLATAYIFIMNTLVSSALAGFVLGISASVVIANSVDTSLNWISVSGHLTVGLLCGFIALYLLKWILALLTAVMGSVYFTSALLLILRKPETFRQILLPSFALSSTPVYYLILVGFLSVCGIAYQFYMLYKHKSKVPGPVANICC